MEFQQLTDLEFWTVVTNGGVVLVSVGVIWATVRESHRHEEKELSDERADRVDERAVWKTIVQEVVTDLIDSAHSEGGDPHVTKIVNALAQAPSLPQGGVAPDETPKD